LATITRTSFIEIYPQRHYTNKEAAGAVAEQIAATSVQHSGKRVRAKPREAILNLLDRDDQ
jgi:hypothetical protein